MQRLKHIGLILLALCLTINGFSQNKLSLLNGKQLQFEKYQVDQVNGYFYYELKKSETKSKTKSVLLEDVYSLIDQQGNVQIFYSPADENELTVEQMGFYVDGYSVSRNDYTPYLSAAGGFIIGVGGMAVSSNPLFSPLIPAVYCAGISFVKPSKDHLLLKYPELAENPDWVYGYQRGAKNQNLKYAVMGSVGGVIVGALIGTFTGYYTQPQF
jgi:hypothetical protein